jgi:UDP-N-acetylglucosamine 2-epimerase (non-hydrolysing)
MKKKICCVIGTRPEIIKMAPVVQALYKTAWADVIVLNTAQHRELADPLYTLFNIKPDIDLNSMQPGQNLAELTASLLRSLNEALLAVKPDIIIAQGDTTTVLAAALTSFYQQIPFAHVEAGLRTHHLYNPFPEETNRVLVARLASLHFAPTRHAKKNLCEENITEASIYVTGNTIVDAVLSIAKPTKKLPIVIKPNRRLILVTVHRRENLGQPLQNICQALLTLVNCNADIDIILPVHANPLVHKITNACLAQHPQISICSALSYDEFIATLKASYLILTDSGGVQEEAAVLGKPLLILRKTTERQEGVIAGVARLVGTQTDTIIHGTQELFNNNTSYRQKAQCAQVDGV